MLDDGGWSNDRAGIETVFPHSSQIRTSTFSTPSHSSHTDNVSLIRIVGTILLQKAQGPELLHRLYNHSFFYPHEH